MNNSLKCVCLILALGIFSCTTTKKETRVLVFSKTEGFRHSAIETGVEALKKMGAENGFIIEATEDAGYFNEERLKSYGAVIFLNTTGDVLDHTQQADFERYIQAGGGFVGVHAATDTEYDWPWYGHLVGAYFDSHPHIQEATLNILDKTHLSTNTMDDTWTKKDEWYNFKNINPDVNVLISIDENSYEGGKNGVDHPISWYHDYNGGKAFYTEMGHTEETYANPTFMNHLLGGIKYAMSSGSLDYGKATTERIPSENRFVRTVLDFNLNEPMELDEIPGKGILFVERRGQLKLFDFKSEKTMDAGSLAVAYGIEDGLLGLAVDPNFEENNWIYLFYSPLGDEPLQHVSRFDFVNNSIDLSSEKIILKIPTLRLCCHSGGSLEFGPNGNLFIGVGDNTNPFESAGFAPIDERPGRALWDAQKSAGNTNDLRGKILRIKPEADGTYSIPDGNLFPVGTAKTRPEIYIMGNRNPFRISIDSKTGYLYWGDVGPDAGKGVANRGPKGMGEFDQAREAGFYGWPYTRGNNQTYNDFDFTTNVSGPKFDPNNIINNSPNNTGLEKLPPVKKSQIWFSYDESEEFPWLGTGGVNPMSGPVFHKSDQPNASTNFPSYFENKLFLYEWMRDWIYVITLDNNHDYVKADPFMPKSEFSHPMDMIFGSDGNFYVLEYGQSWNTRNMDARLNRISYVAGNRKPIAKIAADKTIGAAPLTVAFTGDQSLDFDADELSYAWTFSNDGEIGSTDANPAFTFKEIGEHEVTLTVKDKEGEIATVSQKILVGNDSPVVDITIDSDNLFYWPGRQIPYKVSVIDAQDGSTENQQILSEQVDVSITFIPEGKDKIVANVGHQQVVGSEGKEIIDGADCKTCHALDKKVNGPSYKDIANKYTASDIEYLTDKVMNGGSGVWGETMMIAHPDLSTIDAKKIVNYILGLKSDHLVSVKNYPLSGKFNMEAQPNDKGNGVYMLKATYTDKGIEGLDNAYLSASHELIFKAPILEAENSQRSAGISTWNAGGQGLVGSIKDKSTLKFDKVPLKDLKKVTFSAYFGKNYQYDGTMEVRLNGIDGPLLGKVNMAYFSKEKTTFKDYKINVSPKEDMGDIYLVFKNDKDPDQFVCNANSIKLSY